MRTFDNTLRLVWGLEARVSVEQHQLDGYFNSNRPSSVGLQSLLNRRFGGIFVLSCCALNFAVGVGAFVYVLIIYVFSCPYDGPKNANLVEDVGIWLRLKCRWILLHGFGGEVKNMSAKQTPGGHIGFPMELKNTHLVDDVEIFLPVKSRWIPLRCLRGE